MKLKNLYEDDLDKTLAGIRYNPDTGEILDKEEANPSTYKGAYAFLASYEDKLRRNPGSLLAIASALHNQYDPGVLRQFLATSTRKGLVNFKDSVAVLKKFSKTSDNPKDFHTPESEPPEIWKKRLRAEKARYVNNRSETVRAKRPGRDLHPRDRPGFKGLRSSNDPEFR